MNIQGWFPLGLTGWISSQSRNSQESSPTPQLESINLAFSLLYGPTLRSIYDYWKNHSFDNIWDFPGGSEVKASAWNSGDPGSIPGSGRSPGEGNGNPLQYSCHGESQGGRSLVGYSPRGRKESDTTERLHLHFDDTQDLCQQSNISAF